MTTTTQKDQMLNGASPTAIATAQKPAATPPAAAPVADTSAPAAQQADAAAAAVPAAAAATPPAKANLPNPPAPGEKCQTCGQVMPDDDDDDDLPNDPDAAAPGGYTVEAAAKTLELCTIAKVPVATAMGFVKTKMPVSKVRGELAKMAAQAVDALPVDATAPPAGQTEAAVAVAWDEVVGKINANLPNAAQR